MTGAAHDEHPSVSGKAVESIGKIPEWNVTSTGRVASIPFVRLTHVEEHGAAALQLIRLVGSHTARPTRQSL